MSLDAYAEKNKRRGGVPCSVCSLPPNLLAEIEAGHRKHSHQTMSDYLKRDHGLSVGQWSLGKHFRSGHKKEVA